MNGAALQESREFLRQAALARREALTATDCLLWSRQIQARVLELDYYDRAAAIALYSPIHNEVATGAIIEHALGAGKRVFLPRSAGALFEFAQIASGSDLVGGRYGILEPAGGLGLTSSDRESLLVFVPGVAFDCAGNRLGRGAGWYDRLLANLGSKKFAIGLAYEFQIVDAVPAQPWDCRVNLILTEKRAIDCGALPPGSMRN